MLGWLLGFWLFAAMCWVSVLVADTTPGEKDRAQLIGDSVRCSFVGVGGCRPDAHDALHC